MAFRILDNLQMDPEDIATIVTAIGNHDEGDGCSGKRHSGGTYTCG